MLNARDFANHDHSDNTNDAFESQSTYGLDAILEATKPYLTVAADAFDSNDWLFDCANGTIDLKTGELRKHDSTDMITKVSPVEYDAKAKCPTWRGFLDQVFDGDKRQISFVKRAVGCSLAGGTSRQLMFDIYGKGIRGKITFLRTVTDFLGDYAMPAAPSGLEPCRSKDPMNDVADLHGTRVLVTNGIRVGERPTGRLVNAMTRKEESSARSLFFQHFNVDPTWTVWHISAHMPEIKVAHDGSANLVRSIPFDEITSG